MGFDYTALGHVTVDVLEDGTRRPGGSAFYAALQAARLGKRALVHTRGDAAQIEELLAPYRAEFELSIEPAGATTTLATGGSGAGRRQRVIAWAGELEDGVEVDTDVLHIAPVAREAPAGWRGRAAFVGLTPQGLVRRWSGEGGEIALVEACSCEQAPAAARRCDAVVLNTGELASCSAIVAAARERGAVVAVTSGAQPTRLLLAHQRELSVPVPAPRSGRARVRDDLGAGDVFAAAFFVALHERSTPEQAARFASAAAAVRVEGEGARAIGTREQILARAAG